MRLIVVSGRSGSGKSTALNVLEDCGFNCVDNLPASLIKELVEEALADDPSRDTDLAICIDARNKSLNQFIGAFMQIDRSRIDCELIYLDALDETLGKRFSQSQRRHPLATATQDLQQTIILERGFLEKIADMADLRIDTNTLSERELRNLIIKRVVRGKSKSLDLAFCSFGYKNGVPLDSDYVFDMRCLPNPYWIKALQPLTGLDQPVVQFFKKQEIVEEMLEDIIHYLSKWIRYFEQNNRLYITVGIGCTGGQHRSVYIAERLSEHFITQSKKAIARHRDF